MSLPRQRPNSQPQTPILSDHERRIYELIKSKTDIGISSGEIKMKTLLPQNVITKCQKSLQTKNLVKIVANVHNKGKKYLMAVEFEPSSEVTGGTWYSAEGTLDHAFINVVKSLCLKHIDVHGAATAEDMWKAIVATGVVKKGVCDLAHIQSICSNLVLEQEIEEVKSTGAGQKCYRRMPKYVQESVCASVPCGVCPRRSDCTEEGLISPKTCVYYTKWLGLDF